MTQTLSPTLQNFIQTKNLDISIVEVNDLGLTSRMDAEAYRPQFFKNELKIKSHKWGYFSDFLIDITGGATPLGANYLDFGVPFIRVQNVMQNYFNLNDIVYISNEDDQKLKRSRLRKNDVMLTITGVSYGKSATVDDTLVGSNMNQHSVRMQFSNLNPFYISTFLNSTFGKSQSDKNIVGLSRPALDYDSIKGFFIPLPSQPFQEKIASLVLEAHKQRELSKSLYGEAEKILLDELGLSNWKPSEENIAVKNSDEVSLFGRCDAEFFQPKYDEIIEKIKSYKGGFDTIDTLIEVYSKLTHPKDHDEYQYCELADIDASLGIVNNYSTILGKDLPSRAKMKIEKGDVLVSSVAGSCQKVALIESSDENLIASTGFFILKPKAFNTETNLVLMKSFFMQLFLEKSARGMILSATNQEDFKKLIIPNIDFEIQSLISSKIIASHIARETSRKLLEQAKRAVEIFIEEDEQSAEKFLELNT